MFNWIFLFFYIIWFPKSMDSQCIILLNSERWVAVPSCFPCDTRTPHCPRCCGECLFVGGECFEAWSSELISAPLFVRVAAPLMTSAAEKRVHNLPGHINEIYLGYLEKLPASVASISLRWNQLALIATLLSPILLYVQQDFCMLENIISASSYYFIRL